MEDPSSRVLIDMILATFGNGETFTKALEVVIPPTLGTEVISMQTLASEVISMQNM